MRCAGLFLALAPVLAGAAEFSVVSAVGTVNVIAAGQPRVVHPGEIVASPVHITTAPNSGVQLLGTDGVQLALGSGTEMRIHESDRSFALVTGEVAIWTEDKTSVVNAAGSVVRTKGYLRLKVCALNCSQPKGVYGRGHGGEVVAEYKGGRMMLRERLFLLPEGGGKPELLAKDVGLLGETPNFDSAVAAKQATANKIQQGLADFKAGRYDEAKQTLTQVREISPAEVIVSYYLGLIALEQQRNTDALRELQRYAKEDAAGAVERDVNKLLTLLTSAALQQEVGDALAQEKSVSELPPEPGSIAVQTFATRSTAANAALGKGIAAMVISDLTKVPGLKVLERQKVQKITDEIRLNTSGIVDSDTAVRAGRLMRAERIVVGNMDFE